MDGVGKTLNKAGETVQKSLHTVGEKLQEGAQAMKQNYKNPFEVDSDKLPNPDPDFTQNTL